MTTSQRPARPSLWNPMRCDAIRSWITGVLLLLPAAPFAIGLASAEDPLDHWESRYPDPAASFFVYGGDRWLGISVLANDADAEGDPLEVVAVTQPTHGTAVLSADGTVTYTATEAFSGFDTFTYTISDGLPGTTSATVYVALWAEALSSAVMDLVESGASLPADGKSLLILLQNANYASTHGYTTTAVGKLNAFIAQTEAFVKSGKLTVSEGEDLIEAAEAAIDLLAG